MERFDFWGVSVMYGEITPSDEICKLSDDSCPRASPIFKRSSHTEKVSLTLQELYPISFYRRSNVPSNIVIMHVQKVFKTAITLKSRIKAWFRLTWLIRNGVIHRWAVYIQTSCSAHIAMACHFRGPSLYSPFATSRIWNRKIEKRKETNKQTNQNNKKNKRKNIWQYRSQVKL